MADTIHLGPLRLEARQNGASDAFLDVDVYGADAADCGNLTLRVEEWLSLRQVAQVLEAADRRIAERDEYDRMLREILAICDDSTRASIGADAPLRAVKRLKANHDSYANSNFEGQLSWAYAEIERLRDDLTRLTVELAALKRSDSGRDEEVRRMADECWDHFETYGTWPLWATEQLVTLLRSKP